MSGFGVPDPVDSKMLVSGFTGGVCHVCYCEVRRDMLHQSRRSCASRPAALTMRRASWRFRPEGGGGLGAGSTISELPRSWLPPSCRDPETPGSAPRDRSARISVGHGRSWSCRHLPSCVRFILGSWFKAGPPQDCQMAKARFVRCNGIQ